MKYIHLLQIILLLFIVLIVIFIFSKKSSIFEGQQNQTPPAIHPALTKAFANTQAYALTQGMSLYTQYNSDAQTVSALSTNTQYINNATQYFNMSIMSNWLGDSQFNAFINQLNTNAQQIQSTLASRLDPSNITAIKNLLPKYTLNQFGFLTTALSNLTNTIVQGNQSPSGSNASTAMTQSQTNIQPQIDTFTKNYTQDTNTIQSFYTDLTYIENATLYFQISILVQVLSDPGFLNFIKSINNNLTTVENSLIAPTNMQSNPNLLNQNDVRTINGLLPSYTFAKINPILTNILNQLTTNINGSISSSNPPVNFNSGNTSTTPAPSSTTPAPSSTTTKLLSYTF